jgi:hypothetical protein
MVSLQCSEIVLVSRLARLNPTISVGGDEAMFTCTGTKQSLTVPHQHELAADAKRCYGLIPVYATRPAEPVIEEWQQKREISPGRVFVFGRKDHPGGPLSFPQYTYITGGLKGDGELALTLTYAEASSYISRLKTSSGGRVEPRTATEDPRMAMLAPLLRDIREGYYATRKEEGAPITFLRVSCPTKGQYKGAIKIQTVHGTGYGGSTKLKLAAVHWPSGRWTWERGQEFVKGELFLLCADSFGASMLYAEKIGNCCRCNATLTDKRSRWNGIGPDCEEYWPHILAMVAESKGVWAGQNG